MKHFFVTIIIFLTLCVTSVTAQSAAEVQPVPASRDAVISPVPAAAAPVNTDSTGVSIDSQRDTQLPAQNSTDEPAGNSGQPAPSVRKPD